MQYVIKYSFLLVFVFCFIVATSQERNVQLWNQNKLEVKLNDRLSLGASEKISYQLNSGEVKTKFGELYVKRQINDWFEAGLTGRLLRTKNGSSFYNEYRPMVFGNISAGAGIFDFEFSNRFEYRMFKYLDDHFRHRHMLSMELHPFYNASWLKVYLGEETFFRFDDQKFNLVRFHTGTKIFCADFLEMKLFYVFEKSKKSIHWNTTDILGLNMNLDF